MTGTAISSPVRLERRRAGNRGIWRTSLKDMVQQLSHNAELDIVRQRDCQPCRRVGHGEPVTR